MDDEDTDSDDKDQEYEEKKEASQQVLLIELPSASLTQCQQWEEDLQIFFFCKDIPDDQVRH